MSDINRKRVQANPAVGRQPEIVGKANSILNEVILGEFYEGERTWVGTSINVITGFTPLGWIADVRDTFASGKKFFENPSTEPALAVGIAIIGFIPGGDLVKGLRKGGKKLLKGKKTARGIGEKFIKKGKRLEVNVDLALQRHKNKTKFRLGAGREVESAHLVNSSSLKNIPGYSRDSALTVLLPTRVHRKFDKHWKAKARELLKDQTHVKVAEWEKILNDAIESVPELKGRTGDTMSFAIRNELYHVQRLNADDLIRMPFSK
ncbi:MAG: hypothetical protein H6566_18265 [Lewinellaceae bacterium]|nr:hypothetical protein [Lewinellaceae bacterium]